MIDEHRVRDDLLIDELLRLRQRNQELESSLNRYRHVDALFKQVTEKIAVGEYQFDNQYKTELELKVEERTKELFEANQKMTDILSCITDGFCVLDSELRFTYVNQTVEMIIGLPREAMIGRTLGEFPNVSPIMFEKYHQVLREKVPQNYEFFSQPIQRWVEVSVYPAQTGISVYFRDITERKKAEEDLKNLHQEKIDILESTSDHYFVLDKNLRNIYINRAAERIVGPRESLLGRTLKEIIPNYNSEVFGIYQQVLQEKKPRHCEVYSEHYQRWSELSVYPLNEKIVVCSRDITERKLAEQALHQSEERFYTAFHSSPALMCIQSLDGCAIDVNETWLRVLGFSRNEVIGFNSKELNLYNDPAQWLEVFQRLNESGRLHNYEIQARTKKGEFITLLSAAENIQLHGERCLLWHHIDITERKKVEEELHKSEEKFYKAFHMIPMLMSITTVKDGTFLEVNEAMCSVTGYTREELIGRTSKELNIFPDYEQRSKYIDRLLKDGSIKNFEIDTRTKSGEIRNCLFSSQLLQLDGELCHITGVVDITEQKRMEKEIARLDRLSLVGEMAASIGHEIRNPMTVIRGFLQLLNSKERYKEDRMYFKLMIEELDRANEIISEYLGMAKNKVVKLQPKYLDQVVKSLYPMLMADANEQEKDINLDLSKPLMALIDENEIRQLILNMTRNGLEAMSAHGILTIGTSEEGNEIVLFIKDEGQGISADLLDKLGTPFVTTKDNGTGLGLAVCFSIAARHNARIDFKTGSEGTTFNIRFPLPVKQILLV